MTQEDKDLLLKDLCTRLPYGVKCEIIRWSPDGEMVFFRRNTSALKLTMDNFNHIMSDDCYEVKPYLFPMSSMTDKQTQELESLMEIITIPVWGEILSPTPEYYDWLNKNHFDYRGLIEKGLAIDATDLNIY